MLGDVEERVSAQKLVAIFVYLFGASLFAMLVGLWFNEKIARTLLFVSLGISAASFAAFAIFSNHPCSGEEWHWSSKAAYVSGSAVWLGLSCAAGLTGPTFTNIIARAALISAIFTAGMMTVGAYIVLLLSCLFAGVCPFSAMQTATCPAGG